MIVIPAIDLKGGKCVRLVHGDAKKETVYSDHPTMVAQRWKAAGATRLHVIDLDGAFSGELVNFEWALRIKKETGLFVQVGGGIRSIEAIEQVLSAGIDRVILGTIVFEQAGLAQAAFEKYNEKIMVALDVRNNEVMSRGWVQNSGFPLMEALRVVEKLGGREIIFTDISRDGTLAGANVNAVKSVMAKTPIKIFAAGGVTTLEDVTALREIGVPGCIVGKAIYDGKMNLSDAIKLTE